MMLVIAPNSAQKHETLLIRWFPLSVGCHSKILGE